MKLFLGPGKKLIIPVGTYKNGNIRTKVVHWGHWYEVVGLRVNELRVVTLKATREEIQWHLREQYIEDWTPGPV